MGNLFIVPTPIGNLEDITLRAIRILKEVDLILAEDTRTTGKLLKHYDISTPQHSYHQHNEHHQLAGIIKLLNEGKIMAMVSDAGTPGISDAGFLLVRECIKNNIEVETLPGATAFVPALVNSGLPCDKFYFEGFLPVKKGRRSRLALLADLEYTIVLYESPHRLVKTLEQLANTFGKNRQASISRELSKIYEEISRGTLEELLACIGSRKIKGEIVIVVGGNQNRFKQ